MTPTPDAPPAEVAPAEAPPEARSAPTPAPDWESVREAVVCPLCDYDLRGLIDPRCPECGFTFEWADLFDPTRKRHPFLFEHHASRNLWSFRRTLVAGLRPHKFWTSLHPTQPSRPGRLALYAFLVVFAAAIPPAAVRFAHATAWSIMITPSVSFRWTSSRTMYLRGAQLFAWQLSGAESVVNAFVYFVLWAAVTYLALLVFRISMRRARIRPVHVARCVVYSFDAVFWAGATLFVAAGSTLLVELLDTGYGPFEMMDYAPTWLTLLTFLLVLHIPYRLCAAYRVYLRFDHPVLTVLASQLIAGLVLFNVFLYRATWDITV